MSTSRAWCFTINNPTEHLKLAEGVRYIIYQREQGAQGTQHFQGYAEFFKPQRLTGAKALLSTPTAHLEKRMGTREQARDYCRKADSRIEGPWELGEWIEGPGTRTDIKTAMEAVKSGKRELEIAEEHPEVWARNFRALERYKQLLQQTAPPRDMPKVYIWWGAAGTGKSKKAQQIPDAYWLPKPENGTLWFDGYDGHETIVVDEFYGWISFDFLRRLCDRYPLILPTKFGGTPCRAKTIIFTSNKPYQQWYPRIFEDPVLLESFERRIFEVTEFTKQ